PGERQGGARAPARGAGGPGAQMAGPAGRRVGAGGVGAACRDPHGRARASELGADAVADLTGDDADAVAGRLAQAVAGRVDLVLDPVWGVPAEAALRVLSPSGRLVNLGSAAGAMGGFSPATPPSPGPFRPRPPNNP